MNSTARRTMLNKVPEVTAFFWIIKILCTTIGESLADYINETLGVGLVGTTWIFAIAFAIALTVQFKVRRYVPAIYWLVVVLVSVVGTLLTDNLTDGHNVPLSRSCIAFAILLAIVFATWYKREGARSRSTPSTRSRARLGTGSPCWSPSPSAPLPATGP